MLVLCSFTDIFVFLNELSLFSCFCEWKYAIISYLIGTKFAMLYVNLFILEFLITYYALLSSLPFVQSFVMCIFSFVLFQYVVSVWTNYCLCLWRCRHATSVT
jgi:hypothetical protein